MNQLIFLYDDLMLKEIQKKLNVKLQFLSAGVINAKRYRLNDTKHYREFIIPKHTTNLIYGGIFLVRNYDENKYKLHAWHNNSIPFTNQTMKEDLYDCQILKITPIKFKDTVNTCVCGECISAICFIGNINNKQVKHSINKPYWKIIRNDFDRFYKMVSENRKEN